MKNRTTILLILVSVFFSKAGMAQDFHLTQHREAALYFNPALTGTYTGINQSEEADYRVALDARSQWRSLGLKPYNTGYLAYDQKYERFGIGAYLINNNSGSGNLNVLQFQVSGNYNITERGTPHILTAGLQLGLIHKSFDPNEFTYQNQYSANSGGFDPQLSNGENFSKTSKFNFDANIGLFYKYNDKSNMAQPYLEVATYHLTRPNESFYSENKRVPMRWVGRVGSEITIKEEKFLIQPDLLFMYQAQAQEIHLGLNTRYNFDEMYSLLFGAGYRVKDAVTLQLGFKRNRNLIKFGYDINTSFLQPYTLGQGAMELSIVLMGINDEPLFTKQASFQ